MTNVNKKYLEDNLTNSVWKNFVRKTAGIKTKEDFKKVFGKILTPGEQILLEKRLAILFLVERGLSHREIGRILDVSPTTVGFIKNGFSHPKKNIRLLSARGAGDF